MKTKEEILALLPYGPGFTFVDELSYLDEQRVEGHYHFKPESYFYAHHFKDKPVTPGVILTECMAQIGLVSLGLFLLLKERPKEPETKPLKIAFTEAQVQFKKPVLPGETVSVTAEKIYWRMGKLKVKTEMRIDSNKVVCSGTLSGMIFK